MADSIGNMPVDLAQREAAIEKALTAWARFHLTLDRSIQAESDSESRDTYASRQAFEFAKVLACQTAYPLTRAQFQRALRAAGAEPDAEARFEEQYQGFKLHAIKARTLETAYAYKHALRRAEQRLEAVRRAPIGGIIPSEVVQQAKAWFSKPIPARYMGLL